MPRSLVKVAVLWSGRAAATYGSRRPPACARPSGIQRSELQPRAPPRAALQPLCGIGKHAVVPPSTIQAEGLVLQRSTNMAGYKHVGKDKNRPRPFEVKMWHKGKQVRLVRSPKTCGLRGSSPQSCSPYCFPHRSSVGPA